MIQGKILVYMITCGNFNNNYNILITLKMIMFEMLSRNKI